MSNNVAKRSGEKGPFNQFVSNFSLPGLLRFFFDAPFLKAAFKALVFKSSTPRGLKNLGNTCYINSVIQCVSSCQDFLIYLQKFRRVDSNFASKLLKCFNEMHEEWHLGSVAPRDVFAHVVQFDSRFSGYDQQDAEELFQCIHAILDKERERHGKHDAPCNPFEGLLTSELECQDCQHRRPPSSHPFTCLTLPIPTDPPRPPSGGSDGLTLESCLDKFGESEELPDVECAVCSHIRTRDMLRHKLGQARAQGGGSQGGGSQGAGAEALALERALAVVEAALAKLTQGGGNGSSTDPPPPSSPPPPSFRAGDWRSDLAEAARAGMRGRVVAWGCYGQSGPGIGAGFGRPDPFIARLTTALSSSTSSTSSSSTSSSTSSSSSSSSSAAPSLEGGEVASVDADASVPVPVPIAMDRAVAAAKKTLSIGRLPAVLCLHINRLVFNARTSAVAKLSHKVSFPLVLDPRPWLSLEAGGRRRDGAGVAPTRGSAAALVFGAMVAPQAHTPSSGSTRLDADSSSGPGAGVYMLRALVVHQGSAHGGHYIAYRRVDTSTPSPQGPSSHSQWWHFSDQAVRKASVHEVLSCQAYMLFYERLQEQK